MLDEVVLMPMSFFNQITGRLSVEGAKIFCSCNPSSPWHWFKKEVLDKMREKDGLYIHFTMEDNPSLSEEVKARYRKMYSGVWAKRFISGLWVASSGLIYDMFNENINLIAPENIPYEDAIKWCVGVDYGTANATAFLLMFKDSKGVIYACKEWYFEGRAEAELNNNYDSQKTDLEYSEDAKNFIGENYNLTGLTYRDIVFVVDPAANSFKLQLRRRKFKTKNGNNEVLDGVRTVASYMGQGKFKVSAECKMLLKEIHTYSWDVKAQEKDGIDRILKKNDHVCDAARYGVMYLKDKNDVAAATLNVGV